MRWCALFLALLLGLAIAGLADARMHAGPNMLTAGHRLKGTTIPGMPAPPLDAIATPVKAAYGFRKLRTAYAGAAMRLQRFPLGDVVSPGFINNQYDEATARTFCTLAGQTCIIETWYDQGPNGYHVPRSGGAPLLRLDCKGNRPCSISNGGAYNAGGPFPMAAGKSTLNFIGYRGGNIANGCGYVIKGANQITPTTPANTWFVTDYTSGSFNFTAADDAWHAITATIGGDGIIPSMLNLDGVETSNPPLYGDAVNPNNIIIAVGNGTGDTICQEMEALIWDNYVLSPAERAALAINQRTWGGI